MAGYSGGAGISSVSFKSDILPGFADRVIRIYRAFHVALSAANRSGFMQDISGSGSIAATNNAFSIQQATGTTINSRASIIGRASDGTSLGSRALSSSNTGSERIVQLVGAIPDFTQCMILVGLTNAALTTSEPTDGIYFLLDTVGSSGTISAVTRQSSTSTTTSSVATPSNTIKKFEIDCSDITSIKFKINDTIVATHTANIPTAALAAISHVHTKDTSSKRIDTVSLIDSFRAY